MSSVRIKNLGKSYGTNEVLKDISLEIENGKFITLLGPSGCGKSTLLRCIAGLNEVNEGQIFFDGEDVTNLSPQKRNIGMVFQNYALFPNLTVWENVAFGLKVGRMDKKKIEIEVAKYIKLVDLNGKEKALPHQLSGGQRQRVALARALVMQPRILLLDEPLSALDAKIRKSLRMQIRQIQKELCITTIFVTHDQEEALIISDEIFVINNGEIAQRGTAEAIYTQPADAFVAGFIGNYNILSTSYLKMLGNSDDLNGDYAVRPEVMSVSKEKPNNNQLQGKGVITDVVLLGSIIRYTVLINRMELFVDTLNEHEKTLMSLGENVYVSFNIKRAQKLVVS